MSEFRTIDCGGAQVEVNSRPMDDSRYVDHSRLRTRPEVIQSHVPGKEIKFVEVPVSITENVRHAAGDLAYRSSYRGYEEFHNEATEAGQIAEKKGDKK